MNMFDVYQVIIEVVWLSKVKKSLHGYTIAGIATVLNDLAKKSKDCLKPRDHLDLLHAVIEHYQIKQPVLDGRISESWKTGSLTLNELVEYVLRQLVQQRKLRHKDGCAFETTYATICDFSESSGGEEREVRGSVDFGGSVGTQVVPFLRVSTGDDGCNINFKFCPTCGVEMNPDIDVDD